MIARTIIFITALALAGTFPVRADQAGKERLRHILEKKFGGKTRIRTRSITPRAPRVRDDLFVIDPSGKVRRAPSSTTKSNGRQSSNKASTLNIAGAAGTDISLAGNAGRATHYLRTRHRWRSASNPKRTDSTPVASKLAEMVVNRKVIVIQLRPGISGAEIDALINKYNLNVVDAVPSLGALYVELKEPAGGPPKLRSVAPKDPNTVRSLLEPPIVQRLRREPSVNACFVQTTIGPQTLPRSSGLKVKLGKKSISWNWHTGRTDDGNWGLKSMRMPPVWRILARTRRGRAKVNPARVAILDSGFGKHRQLKFANVAGTLPAAPILADCGHSHGTHVAGIIGANFDSEKGINGIVPKARLDAVPISKNLMLEGAMEGRQRSQLHLSYFADVIRNLAEYFDEFPLAADERRVVNISLAYNWAWVSGINAADPTTDQSVRNQILQHANFIQYLMNRVSDQVLFVAAAGNDSAGLKRPLNAELATPFGFAALHKSSFFTPSKNILIVEAHDRKNARADFSNIGGHVAAPGVDVMSTLASDTQPFGVCNGTSQAAPHVAALAAILFELKPTAKPVEIAQIITSSALSGTESAAAPRVDALASVLMLSGDHLRYLADLNSDGKVNAGDLALFKQGLMTLEGGRFGGAINADLNRDGMVDDNERCWPLIDLNGSGRASYDAIDKRPIGGAPRSDLEVIEAAWTDKAETFQEAMAQSHLAELIDIWRATSLVAAVPSSRTRLPCQ